MHHIKIDITYISTYFERFNLLSCYCYRKTNSNYNKSNSGYDMGKEGKDFPNSSHIQHHSSHSVNGPDFSAVIQYVFYVYCSVHRWSILIIVEWDATQSSLFIILQVHSTCFGCQPNPSSGVHKIVSTASGTGHNFFAATSLQRGQVGHVGGSTSTGGCSYSFVYSWWWVWLTPETCRVNLQNKK